MLRHVQSRPAMAPARKSLSKQVGGPSRKRDRPNMTWIKVVRLDVKICNLSEDLAVVD